MTPDSVCQRASRGHMLSLTYPLNPRWSVVALPFLVFLRHMLPSVVWSVGCELCNPVFCFPLSLRMKVWARIPLSLLCAVHLLYRTVADRHRGTSAPHPLLWIVQGPGFLFLLLTPVPFLLTPAHGIWEKEKATRTTPL